jgi:hypothetical protein
VILRLAAPPARRRQALARRVLPLALAGAALLAGPPGASSDTLEVAAAGARGLASGGGWLAWAEPVAGERWRLVVRAPGGRVTRPAVATFDALPQVNIGSDSAPLPRRRLLAVYARCAGDSTVEGCDVHALDLRAGTEARVEPLASRTYSETSPDVVFGRFVLVRRGGPRPGIYTFDPVGRTRPPRRVTRSVAADVAWYGTSRVAASVRGRRGWDVTIRTLFGSRPVLRPATGLRRRPRGFEVQGSRVTWLQGDRAVQSIRTGSPGGRRGARTVPAARALPRGTNSVEPAGRTLRRALTPEGLVLLEPRPRFR